MPSQWCHTGSSDSWRGSLRAGWDSTEPVLSPASCGTGLSQLRLNHSDGGRGGRAQLCLSSLLPHKLRGFYKTFSWNEVRNVGSSFWECQDSLCAVEGGSGDAMEEGNASQGLQTAAALSGVRGKPWRGLRWEFWKEWEKRNVVVQRFLWIVLLYSEFTWSCSHFPTLSDGISQCQHGAGSWHWPGAGGHFCLPTGQLRCLAWIPDLWAPGQQIWGILIVPGALTLSWN